jgi:hypothetical protein
VSQLVNSVNLGKIKERNNADSTDKKKVDEWMNTLVQRLTFHYTSAGYTTIISSKFANKHYYVLKRLRCLVENPQDFNPRGGSKFMTYKGQLWTRDYPSDPELVATIFCRLLDDGYFSIKEKQKTGVLHYIDALKPNTKMVEDQYGLINTQPQGYLPYY